MIDIRQIAQEHCETVDETRCNRLVCDAEFHIYDINPHRACQHSSQSKYMLETKCCYIEFYELLDESLHRMYIKSFFLTLDISDVLPNIEIFSFLWEYV